MEETRNRRVRQQTQAIAIASRSSTVYIERMLNVFFFYLIDNLAYLFVFIDGDVDVAVGDSTVTAQFPHSRWLLVSKRMWLRTGFFCCNRFTSVLLSQQQQAISSIQEIVEYNEIPDKRQAIIDAESHKVPHSGLINCNQSQSIRAFMYPSIPLTNRLSG